MTLRIVKGGKQVDRTSEVNSMFARLCAQAAFHRKTEEFEQIQEFYQNHFIDSSEHVLLLEIFDQFKDLLFLPPAPLSFISSFIEQLSSNNPLEQDNAG